MSVSISHVLVLVMGSLKLVSISLDTTTDSRKLYFTANPPQFASIFSLTSCIHFTRSCVVTCLDRFQHANVSSSETELYSINEPTKLDDDNNLAKRNLGNESFHEQKLNFSRKIRKRSYGDRKGTKRDLGLNFSFGRNYSEEEREYFSVSDGELDVDYSVLELGAM